MLLITYRDNQPGPVGSGLERNAPQAEGLGQVIGAVYARWSSYAPLEKALLYLRATRPSVYRAVRRYFIDDKPVQADARLAIEGVNLLTSRMPHWIHVPRDVLANSEVLLRRKVRH